MAVWQDCLIADLHAMWPMMGVGPRMNKGPYHSESGHMKIITPSILFPRDMLK